MKPAAPAIVALGLLCGCGGGGGNSSSGGGAPGGELPGTAFWGQWGASAQHHGAADAAGQSPDRVIVEMVLDPFVPQERAVANGSLLVHYPVPLISGENVFVVTKSGSFRGPDTWDSQQWSWKRLRWQNGALSEAWTFATDWKPVPHGGVLRWEPVHQGALAGTRLYVPGAGGTVYKLDASSGAVQARINPFGAAPDASIFVTGPLAADPGGNVYYNALRLDLADPWNRDALDAWVVRVGADDRTSLARYAALVPGAPAAGSSCLTTFTNEPLPWPPSPDAAPPSAPCGSQRAGINVAPAVAPDGTVYTVSRAHFNDRYGYLVALGPDLSPRWAASLRERFADGCGVPADQGGVLPPNGAPGGCRNGAALGVDPLTNAPAGGQVRDQSSSSPVVAPDGAVLYGAYTRYNYSRGHLMKFSPGGAFLATYPFGWDITPGVQAGGSGYTITVKDNNYAGLGSYCGGGACPPGPLNGRYFVTRLSGDSLRPLWSFENPSGDEWCINAPALDRGGNAYGIAEDGYLYAIGPDGSLRQRLFLETPLAAAYTPLSIDAQGRLYAQNAGHLFVAGR